MGAWVVGGSGGTNGGSGGIVCWLIGRAGGGDWLVDECEGGIEGRSGIVSVCGGTVVRLWGGCYS